MTLDELDTVLEAVADGALDALRDKSMPHLTLAVKLELANRIRRAVAAKLGEPRPTEKPGEKPASSHLPTEFKA